MNFNKTTLALVLSHALFFTLPMSSVFANQANYELSASQPRNVIQQIKRELKGYVQGIKSDDLASMQMHINRLLTLSEQANLSMVGMDHVNMADMEHSNMKGMDHANMTEMDHSNMKGMDHANMADMDHSNMKGMDHVNMADMDHSNMKGMDHTKMSHKKHQQHMAYMSGMPQLQQQFEALNQTMDKTEIKAILLQVKSSLEAIGPQSI